MKASEIYRKAAERVTLRRDDGQYPYACIVIDGVMIETQCWGDHRDRFIEWFSPHPDEYVFFGDTTGANSLRRSLALLFMALIAEDEE